MFTLTVIADSFAKSYDVYGNLDESIDAALTMVEGASDGHSVTLRKDGETVWVATYANGDCVDWQEFSTATV